MAYFRGDDYIWSDGEDLHLWSRDGYDGWDSRYEDENEQRYPGWENASGVAIREETINQFVMMRVAELLTYEEPQRVQELLEQAVEVGNFGSRALEHNLEVVKAAFAELQAQLETPPRL